MLTDQQKEKLRALPGVDQLLETEPVAAWLADEPRTIVVQALRSALAEAREALLAEEAAATPTGDEVIARAQAYAAGMRRRSLRRAINATGIIVHTGLGRSRLSEAAIQAMVACAGHCTLELDLETGERGSRHRHLESLLCELTGAPAGIAVNNNAAAVMLALNTIAEGNEVIVSRGQLVEIGGSFRLPTIMRQSGCRLVEVGTTNRTRLADYANAVSHDTAALLKVHTSNFRQIGFVEETPTAELAQLAREHYLVLMEDLGSGALLDTTPWLGEHEPTCQDSLSAGADLVCFSGDKLLGGPQAGIIVGRQDLIEEMKHNPLARALRLDKLTIAALVATLELYRDPEAAARVVPTLAAAAEPAERVRARARRLRSLILKQAGNAVAAEVVESEAAIGGGALPGQTIPSWAVALTPLQGSAEDLARALRLGDPPVIGRLQKDRLLLDCRALTDEELAEVADIIGGGV